MGAPAMVDSLLVVDVEAKLVQKNLLHPVKPDPSPDRARISCLLPAIQVPFQRVRYPHFVLIVLLLINLYPVVLVGQDN